MTITKHELRAVAADLGIGHFEFERRWAGFVAWRALVEQTADRLRITRPSPAFTVLGLAMLEARDMGEAA